MGVKWIQAVWIWRRGGRNIGRIVEALASDQLVVNDINQKKTPERLSDKCCKLQEQLEENLDENGKKLLTELVDAIYDEEYLETLKRFNRGYSLGVLMTMEVFEDYNSFFGKGEKGEYY